MLLIKQIFFNKYLLILLSIMSFYESFGQSYSNSPNDSIVSFANINSPNVFNITQLHPTNDTLYFKWNKESVSLPSTWEASICDNGHCYTSLIDSGSMDAVYVGDVGLMSLHLNPHVESGTAIIRYTISEISTPSQIDTLTWIITVGATGINSLNYKTPSISIRDQVIYLDNIDKSFTSLTLIDLNGKLIFECPIRESAENIFIPKINLPFVIVQLNGSHYSHKQKINIISY